jgi:hypothetical protein
MKTRGRNRNTMKNKTKRRVEKSEERRCVEYSVVGCKVVVAFSNIFGMCRRESI